MGEGIGAITGFGGASDALTSLMNDYNNYIYGENAGVADPQAFAHSGIPVSTNETASTIGAEANKTYMTAREQDATRAANQQVANAQKGAISSGVTGVAKLAGGIGI